MSLENTLLSIGLDKKEIDAYLAILELGEAKIAEIARKSGLKRPTVYLILESLEKKGLISQTRRGKKLFFTPEHPQKLISETEFKLKELTQVIPQLELVFNQGEDKPRVLIYEGKDALDRAYEEWFVVKGEAVYMGTIKLSLEMFPKTYRNLQYVTLKENFKLRELVDESEDGKAYAEKNRNPYREIRFLPQNFLPFEADIGVFGNRVLITSVKKEYFTVGIESKEIAQVFYNIFNIMWSMAAE